MNKNNKKIKILLQVGSIANSTIKILKSHTNDNDGKQVSLTLKAGTTANAKIKALKEAYTLKYNDSKLKFNNNITYVEIMNRLLIREKKLYEKNKVEFNISETYTDIAIRLIAKAKLSDVEG